METGFLNFHDEKHFSDFSLSLDHQHNLLGESQSSIVQMVDNDLDYVESLGFDSNDVLWETEQELNGDLAVLPVSGVAGIIPKIENIKEDFAKVLTDWQEHIGYLQASEIEEDIDMVNLDMGLHLNSNSIDNIFENTLKFTEKVSNSFAKYEEPSKNFNNLLNNHIKCDIDYHKTNHASESDQSEKEIDVVGLDSVGNVNSIIDFMHNRRKHIKTSFIEHNSKTLDADTISIKQEPINILMKDTPQNLVNEIFPTIFTRTMNSEFSKNNKKKRFRKPKEENTKKKNRKTSKIIARFTKKPQKDFQLTKQLIQESNNSNITSISQKIPALEAVDIKSLLEQFEATEATSISSNFSLNKCKETFLKKLIESQELKFDKDKQNSFPKEVIERIKVTNKNCNSNNRVDGSVQLDHDYCSNFKLYLSNSTSSSNDNNSNSYQYKSDYTREINNSEKLILIKEKSHKKKDICNKGTAEHLKFIDYKVSFLGKHNWMDTGSKKDSGLESGELSDASEEQPFESKIKEPVLQEMMIKESKEVSSLQPSLHGKNKMLLLNKVNITPTKPFYEMKIQSALATSILQLQKGVLTKTKSLDTHKPMQMVSVLKKPIGTITPQLHFGSNIKESVVTTTNSLNDQVQNIIIQNSIDIELPEKKEKILPRRKLNLAEYRSRYQQNGNNVNYTNSSIQPMVLIYIHHASTNTESINSCPDNPVWSEREIVPVLKRKVEIEEKNLKSKQPTTDRGMQTSETVVGTFFNEIKDEKLRKERELYIHKEQKKKVIKGAVNEISIVDVTLVKKKFIMNKLNDKEVKNSEIKIIKTSEDNVEVMNINLVNNKRKTSQINNINCMDHRKHRNYGQVHALTSSSHSSSRSRSCSRSQNRNRGSRNLNRPFSRTRSRRHSYSHSYNHGCTRNFQRSQVKIRDQECNSSQSRSSGSSRSRSRSRSRLRTRCNTKQRRISHRRSSVSSSSSWSSCSRSRSRSSPRYRFFSRSRSRSRSRSSSSRSRSSRYSSCSRSSSCSNFACSKWLNYKTKGRRECKPSFDRLRRLSSSSSHGCNNWRRHPHDEWYIKEKQRQVEERRVIYVGRLQEGITKAELRRRFETFGPVIDISVHFRERGQNYGFVTFAYKNDAYEAVEHGNDDPSLPRYDLCFGGRRAFCKVKYADLDGAASNSLGGSRGSKFKPEEENTFDLLLKEAQAKLRKRKV